MAIDSLCIIGVGLIGGSIAAAARRAWPDLRLVGAAPAEDHDAIRTAGLGIELHTEAEAAVDSLEGQAPAERSLIVLATPPSVTLDLLPQLARRSRAVLTDVCSVKQPIAALAAGLTSPGRLVPGHPMAGSQHRGAGHASAELFQGKPVVLTPRAETDPQAIELVEEFWRTLGARVVRMEAAAHDRAVARASHGVHALAAVAARLLDGREDATALASTGFGDTTRVAGGDAGLWADILLLNAEEVVLVLGEAAGHLQALQRAVERGDEQTLRLLLEEARQERLRWLAARDAASDA
ncbi:MAG: prephenate dehydrogenase [Phycisphaerales bacterium JB038]